MHTISFLAACNKGLILTLESKPSLTLESKLTILHISTLDSKVTKETNKKRNRKEKFENQ